MATKKKAGSKSKAGKVARSHAQEPFVYTVNGPMDGSSSKA